MTGALSHLDSPPADPSQKIRVAIEAEIEAGREGGAEQYLIGLIHDLGRLESSELEFVIVTGQETDWVRHHIGTNAELKVIPRYQGQYKGWSRRMLRQLRKPAGRALRRMRWVILGPPPEKLRYVPVSDGFYESLNADVLHITYPLRFQFASIPTVFTLHDLQHRHLPEFFTDEHLRWREMLYPAAFENSKAIVTIARWVKADLIHQYGVSAEKIYTIPHGPPTEAYDPVREESLIAVKKKYHIPEAFMLFPALTYGHKNHIRLMEAIALLRDRDRLRLNLICTGTQQLHWPVIKRRWHELQLQEQVRFLGFIPADDLRCLYHLTDFLVFPSLFEGAGLPLLEAFREGTAVVCSDIPAFREYGGDAPLYFNCHSAEAIAEVLRKVSGHTELRRDLQARSRKQAVLYSWEQSAAMYQAVYRAVAGKQLSDQERLILSECQR